MPLLKEGAFLRFLLSSAPSQQINLILDNISVNQLKVISEVLFNIKRGNFSNSSEIGEKYRRDKRLAADLSLLGDKKKISVKEKRSIVKQRRKTIRDILNSVRGELIALLNHEEVHSGRRRHLHKVSRRRKKIGGTNAHGENEGDGGGK